VGSRRLSSKLNMATVYKASRLAMTASKAQQSSRTAVAAAKPTKAEAAAGSTTNVVNRTGIKKPWPLSPEMKKFLGVSEGARTEVLKKIWDHIKANNLQNPANKREILCDEKLKDIFGQKNNVGMFEIAKLITPHFIKK